MSRLIDAEDITDYWVESEGSKEEFIKENMPDDADYYDYLDFFYKTLQAFKNIVNTSPTIDAEPVVRCKDCKQHCMLFDRIMCKRTAQKIEDEKYGLDDYYDLIAVEENHYCGFGVKMDDKQS